MMYSCTVVSNKLLSKGFFNLCGLAATHLLQDYHHGFTMAGSHDLYRFYIVTYHFSLYLFYIYYRLLVLYCQQKEHAISSACLIFLLIETVSSHPRNRSWLLQKQLLYLSSRKVRWCGIHIPERSHYHNLLSVRRIH